MAKVYDDQKGAKEEWQKLKGAPLKDKLEYIFEYYRLIIIGGIIGIAMIVSIISGIIQNSVPIIISGMTYTTSIEEENSNALKKYLCEAFGYNEKDYRAEFSTNLVDVSDPSSAYTQMEVLFARMAAKDLDIVISEPTMYVSYMDAEDIENCCFLNLNSVLSEEKIKQLDAAGRLRYFELKDGTSFPYLIDITGTELYETLGLITKNCFIGVASTSPRLESVAKMCDLIN